MARSAGSVCLSPITIRRSSQVCPTSRSAAGSEHREPRSAELQSYAGLTLMCHAFLSSSARLRTSPTVQMLRAGEIWGEMDDPWLDDKDRPIVFLDRMQCSGSPARARHSVTP
jgi:hypothetical protein